MRNLAVAGALSLLVVAVDASAQLATLETEDLRLVYANPAEAFLTPHAGRCFENSMRFQRKLFGYAPSERVTVLLTDFSDSGNAGAGIVPRNNLNVEIAPLNFAYETMVANERMNTIMNHELVHIVANEKPAGPDRFFRTAFQGKVNPVAAQPESILYFYLTTPRAAAPRWYHEGIAVFIDTWMAGGLGRAQGAYDEMVFRAMVKDGSRLYDPLGLASEGAKLDFQTETNSYLYGTRFMTWLAWQYTPEAVIRWVSRTEGSRAYYASQFRQVFGIAMTAAWQQWIAFEREFQEANLDAIRKYPTTPYKDLSPQALGSVSRAWLDPVGHKLYAGLNYPGIVGHVAAISTETGAVEKLRDVKQPSMYTVTSMAWDPDARTIFYTTDNYAYRDLVALDPKTKKTRLLLKDGRVGDLAWSRPDHVLWGIRVYNGVCSLVRIPAPYTDWTTVLSWPYGEVVYDLDVSPDGGLVSLSHGAVNGKQSLRIMSVESLLKGDATPVKVVDFGNAVPENFVFSPDGRYLYGSSYYTGVSNIFRYEIETGSLDAVSNTETGFFRPIPVGGDSLVVFRFTGAGFVPAMINAKPLQDVSPIAFLGERLVEKQPVLKEWKVGAPTEIPFEKEITHEGPYRSFPSIRPESFYPIAQGYKIYAAWGVRANFSDPMRFNNLDLSASYVPQGNLPSSERLHAQANFRRYDWSASVKYNPADFYDLFGPTKTSHKGYGASMGYDRTLVYDTPRTIDVSARAEYWGDLEQLPQYQGIAVTDSTLFQSYARLHGRNVSNSIGHVDDEKGREWDVVLREDVAGGVGYFGALADLDLGFGLPLRHSSIWLRSSAGFSPGDIAQPYSNFYFGGFRNNWVDHREEQRYRQPEALPGVDINQISGRNYVKSTAEWNLPPLRFRRAGTPSFYATWARTSLFATILGTNLDDSALRRTVSNVGAQVDVRLTLLSRLDMTLSGGYAAAFEQGQPARHEAMLSLKVLK